MCFVLGQLCFDQIMKKIENHELDIECDCSKDCIYSKYTMSVKERTILERLTTRSWRNQTHGEGFYKIGTDELEDNRFSGSHWFNMGL